MDAKRHHQYVLQGYKNKYNGLSFEEIITNSCHHYIAREVAVIIKTPEPMRPIRDLGGGKFVAVYEKHAQPDYKGALIGGRAIMFEAKHTDTEELKQSAVTEPQTVSLNYHEKFGAECFVLISFGFRQFFRVPWKVFKAMKEVYGRKYVRPADLAQYRVRFDGMVLHFLEKEEREYANISKATQKTGAGQSKRDNGGGTGL